MPVSPSHPATTPRTEQVPAVAVAPYLHRLLDRGHLSADETRGLMREILAGGVGEAELAAVLVALRMKGETAEELAAAAEVLRESMVCLDPARRPVLDTCGTGGDGAATFNISTASAIVAAGVGVAVVKHGNRAVSSRSGSADVLSVLGVGVEGGPAAARRALTEAGLAFCFAPQFHPALVQVAAVRRRLGVRTLFNCLGPLLNPARAEYQLLGVGRLEWLDPLAGAVARLGTRQTILVAGRDGLDEVSLSGPTFVRRVRGAEVLSAEWTPADFGLEPCRTEDLFADGPQASAAIIRSVLSGADGPPRRIVLANTAAALLAAEKVESVREGVAVAAAAIADGRARGVLERLAAVSRG